VIDADPLARHARHDERDPPPARRRFKVQGFALGSASFAIGAVSEIADDSLGPLCGALLSLTSFAKPSQLMMST
jgi:hypothetical protein